VRFFPEECKQTHIRHEVIPDQLFREISYGGRGGLDPVDTEVLITYTNDAGELHSKKLSRYNIRVVMVPTILAYEDPWESPVPFFETSLRSVVKIEVALRKWCWRRNLKPTLISSWVRNRQGELLRIPEFENRIAKLRSEEGQAAAKEDYESAAKLKAKRLKLEEFLATRTQPDES